MAIFGKKKETLSRSMKVLA